MSANKIIKFGFISIGLYILFFLISNNTPLLSIASIPIVTYLQGYYEISTSILEIITCAINISFWFIFGGILGGIIKDEKGSVIIMIIIYFSITILSLELGQTCCDSITDIKWE